MSDHALPAGSSTVGRLVRPTMITTEMMEFARPSNDDMWHWANNLNAMMRLGYCRKCGLVPDGCHREGCRANAAHDGRLEKTT